MGCQHINIATHPPLASNIDTLRLPVKTERQWPCISGRCVPVMNPSMKPSIYQQGQQFRNITLITQYNFSIPEYFVGLK